MIPSLLLSGHTKPWKLRHENVEGILSVNKLESAIWLVHQHFLIDKEVRGFSPSDQFGQPEDLIAEVYRSVVAV